MDFSAWGEDEKRPGVFKEVVFPSHFADVFKLPSFVPIPSGVPTNQKQFLSNIKATIKAKARAKAQKRAQIKAKMRAKARVKPKARAKRLTDGNQANVSLSNVYVRDIKLASAKVEDTPVASSLGSSSVLMQKLLAITPDGASNETKLSTGDLVPVGQALPSVKISDIKIPALAALQGQTQLMLRPGSESLALVTQAMPGAVVSDDMKMHGGASGPAVLLSLLKQQTRSPVLRPELEQTAVEAPDQFITQVTQITRQADIALSSSTGAHGIFTHQAGALLSLFLASPLSSTAKAKLVAKILGFFDILEKQKDAEEVPLKLWNVLNGIIQFFEKEADFKKQLDVKLNLPYVKFTQKMFKKIYESKELSREKNRWKAQELMILGDEIRGMKALPDITKDEQKQTDEEDACTLYVELVPLYLKKCKDPSLTAVVESLLPEIWEKFSYLKDFYFARTRELNKSQGIRVLYDAQGKAGGLQEMAYTPPPDSGKVLEGLLEEYDVPDEDGAGLADGDDEKASTEDTPAAHVSSSQITSVADDKLADSVAASLKALDDVLAQATQVNTQALSSGTQPSANEAARAKLFSVSGSVVAPQPKLLSGEERVKADAAADAKNSQSINVSATAAQLFSLDVVLGAGFEEACDIGTDSYAEDPSTAAAPQARPPSPRR